MTLNAENPSSRAWSVVAGSAALYILLNFLNPAWIYSYIGWVDAWAYFGHAVDPIGLRNAMPHHPSGDLLPLILPAATFYGLLPPLIANFLYKGAAFIATCSLFFALIKNETGLRTAVLSTLLLAFHRYFLIAVGSDYTDGRVILYLTASLYFFSKAVAEPNAERPRLCLALGGAAFACSVATALLSAVYGLPLLIFILGKSWARGRSPSWEEITFPILGFILLLASLAAVHTVYAGEPVFFLQTINKAKAIIKLTRGVQDFVLFRQGWLYPALFAALALPCHFLIHALHKAYKRPNRGALVFWVMNIAALLPLFYLQYFKKQETISQFLYFDQILPISMSAIAVTVVAPFAESRLKRKPFWAIVFLFLLCGSITFHLTTANEYALHAKTPKYIFNLTLALAAAFMFTKDFAASILCLFLSTYLHANLNTQALEYISRPYHTSPFAKSRSQTLLTTYEWIQLIKAVDKGRSGYLWYNADGDKYFLRGLSAASHLWQGRIYNEKLPSVNDEIGEAGLIPIDTILRHRLIIITENEKEFSDAKMNLENVAIRIECKEKNVFKVNMKKTLDVRSCALFKAPNS